MTGKREKRYTIKLTLDEINALLETSANADAEAVADDFETEAEGDKFLADLNSATSKLLESK